MAANQIDCFCLEQSSLMEFFVAEKNKICDIYQRNYVYGEYVLVKIKLLRNRHKIGSPLQKGNP